MQQATRIAVLVIFAVGAAVLLFGLLGAVLSAVGVMLRLGLVAVLVLGLVWLVNELIKPGRGRL